MAFMIRNCMFCSGKGSLREISRVRYILTDLKSAVPENKKYLTVLQTRKFSTESSDVKIDELNVKTHEIYRGPLTRQVRNIKAVTILTSVAGLLLQPAIYSRIQEFGFSAAIVGAGAIYGTFVLVSPLLIHLLAKRYITRMEYDPKADNYIAHVYTFFLRDKKIEFTPDDVKVPMIAGLFTSIIVKGNPLFLDPAMFDSPAHYSKIMGYDKPMDFSIHSDSEDQKK